MLPNRAVRLVRPDFALPRNIARQFDHHCRSVAFSQALGKRAATMLLGDGAHDKQAQTGAFNVSHGAVGNAIKTLEDALQLRRRNADSVVLDAHPHTLFVGGFDANGNVDCDRRST